MNTCLPHKPLNSYLYQFTLRLLVCFLFSGIAYSSPKLALTHVAIVDVERGRLLEDQTVFIEARRIVQILPSHQANIPSDYAVVDASGKYLIPGLWDMHMHLFDPDTPGPPSVTFPLLVANGVTGVRDIGGALDSMLYWRAQVVQGTLLGPRIVGTGPLLDGVPVVYPLVSRIVETPQEARDAVDSLVARGVDFIKAYEMLKSDVFYALVDQAKRRGVAVVGHVPLAIDAAEASDAGLRSFEHLRNIELACSQKADSLREARIFLISQGASRKGMELRAEIHWSQRPIALDTYDSTKCIALLTKLVKNKTWQVPTLFLSTREALRPDTTAQMLTLLRYIPAPYQADWQKWTKRVSSFSPDEAALRKRHADWLFKLVRMMRDAGVDFLAGTDVSVHWIVPGFSLHEELKTLVDAGLTPLEALQTATINPARYLNATDSIGTIAPNKLADLVLLNANPLEDIRNTQKIHAVIVRGRHLDRRELDQLLLRAEQNARKH